MGLLTGSFLPDGKTEELRTYCRQRSNLLQLAASTSKKIQKNLRLLNLRLDVVVKDICGLTGLLIIRAICDGETDPEKLASLRHGNCRRSVEEIAKALQTNGRKDYLFALQQELDTYDTTCGPLGLTIITLSLSTITAPGADPFTFRTYLQAV